MRKQNKHYKVVARTKRYWFCKPFVVYDVVCCYSAWYDPSYGCGSGDYRDYTKVVARCGVDRPSAVKISNCLNENKV